MTVVKFTLEMEKDRTLWFLDVLVKRSDTGIVTEVYRKPTHSGLYINKNSNHPDCIKRGVIKSLQARAKRICSNEQGFKKEIEHIVDDFIKNGYSKLYVNHSLKPASKVKENIDQNVKGNIVILYVKSFSEKVKRLVGKYGVRISFHSRKTLRNALCKNKPEM